jgi:predicted small metal-binding protein
MFSQQGPYRPGFTGRISRIRPDGTRETVADGLPIDANGLRKRAATAKVIRCECGYVVRGDSDEELVNDAERHIQSDHPDLVGQITREDLLAMREEE